MRALKILVILFAGCSLAIGAQRPLTHRDYDGWRSILSSALSNGGRCLAYGLFPQEGDGVAVVRDLRSGKEWRENAGALPPPPAPDPNSEDPVAPVRTIRLAFTTDSRTVVFLSFPSKAATDKAKKDKKKPEEMPKGELVTIDVASGMAARVADMKSFGLPDRGNGYLVFLKEPAAGAKKELGSDLVLRDLAAHSDRTFPDVAEYSMSRDGMTLVYAVASAKEDADGVYAVSTAGGDARALLAGKPHSHIVE